MKTLAFAPLIKDRFRRIYHQPIGNADYEGKCDRCVIEGREYEAFFGIVVS